MHAVHITQHMNQADFHGQHDLSEAINHHVLGFNETDTAD